MANSVKPWLDQAGKFPIAHIGGIPHFNEGVHLDAPRTGVLHTTEGKWVGSLAIFKQHFAPHFMLGFDNDAGKVRIAQLVQVGTIGAALVTHNNQAIVQIEMVGFSKTTPWLPDDETAAALASLMAVCKEEYGIPLEHPWHGRRFRQGREQPASILGQVWSHSWLVRPWRLSKSRYALGSRQSRMEPSTQYGSANRERYGRRAPPGGFSRTCRDGPQRSPAPAWEGKEETDEEGRRVAANQAGQTRLFDWVPARPRNRSSAFSL